jgi:hypothetical protein
MNFQPAGTVVRAALWLLLAAAPLGAGAAQPEAGFTRVGIVPLRDESGIRDGAKKMTELLRAHLAQRFKGVEFVLVDPAELDLPDGPLLLDEAVRAGEHFKVQALIDGVFQGVEIQGGVWPTLASDTPLARGFLRWRLVECAEGIVVTDGAIHPKRYKVYPKRVRSAEDLERKVMQDLARAAGDALEESGAFAREKKEEEAPAAGPAAGQERQP